MVEPLETKVTFPLDEAEKAKAIAALKELDKQQKGAAASATKGEKSYKDVAKVISGLEKEKRDYAANFIPYRKEGRGVNDGIL